MRFPREKHWQGKPFIGTRSNGGFTAGEIKTPGLEFRNHAITIRSADGLIQLASDSDRIDGFFVAFDGGDLVVYRDTSKGQWARNGTVAAIAPGTRLVGAERAVTDSTKPTHGYVKPADYSSGDNSVSNVNAALVELAKGMNNIVRVPAGKAHSTAANYPPADVVVEIGIASSD